MFLFLSLLLGCTAAKTDSAEPVFEPASPSCSPGSVDAWFQLWSEGGEANVAETEPRCESAFEVTITEDGLTTIGTCEVGGGQQPRALTFDLSGQWIEGNDYSGTVTFTKPNGAQTEGAFAGTCQELEVVQLELTWVMTVTTPNGEVEHSGLISSPPPEE